MGKHPIFSASSALICLGVALTGCENTSVPVTTPLSNAMRPTVAPEPMPVHRPVTTTGAESLHQTGGEHGGQPTTPTPNPEQPNTPTANPTPTPTPAVPAIEFDRAATTTALNAQFQQHAVTLGACNRPTAPAAQTFMGRITVHFIFLPNGTVQGVSLVGAAPPNVVAGCIINNARTWQLPARTGTDVLNVELPVEFSRVAPGVHLVPNTTPAMVMQSPAGTQPEQAPVQPAGQPAAQPTEQTAPSPSPGPSANPAANPSAEPAHPPTPAHAPAQHPPATPPAHPAP